MSDSLNGWRASPIYTISEAARLAGVAPLTVRRWMYGTVDTPSILGRSQDTGHETLVSFLQLIEILIVRDFRKVYRYDVEVIRKAHDNSIQEFDSEYPFAHQSFEPLGGHIISRMEEANSDTSHKAMDEPGLRTLPGLVLERIHTLDYQEELANRWWPIGKNVPIVIDPHYNAGLPTIAERRVTVGAVYKRFMARQSVDFIAGDFQLEKSVVEDVIRYAQTSPFLTKLAA